MDREAAATPRFAYGLVAGSGKTRSAVGTEGKAGFADSPREYDKDKNWWNGSACPNRA